MVQYAERVGRAKGLGPADQAAPIVRLSDIAVQFGAQRALGGVSLDIRRGEVIGLVGANGAGKSTLGRVIVGEVPFGGYSGRMTMDGIETRFVDTKQAHRAGVVLIHQEGAGVEQLTIGENVMLTIEPNARGLIDWTSLHRQAGKALSELGVDTDTCATLGAQGGVALMELVEIARAIARGGRVFVFDESTAALGADEVTILLSRMRDLAAKGAAIIFISHHLNEVLAVCDRIVVLRDGRKVLDAPRVTETHASVIAAMLGRDTFEHTMRMENSGHPHDGPEALGLGAWKVARSEKCRLSLGPIEFGAVKGEILGVYGPLGSGKTELLHSIFGLLPEETTGQMRLSGEAARPFASARSALGRGIALVSAERQKEGIVAELSVLDNMLLGHGRADLVRHKLFICHDSERRLCEQLVAELGIKIDNLDQPISSLSGGNQQKVVLARALINRPQVLLLDEPTRGIDIGARQDVYRWMRKIAAEGTTIIVSSLEEGEILSLTSRVLVLRDGRQVAIADTQGMSEHQLAVLAVGGGLH
ncbi:sugar ABC transporter ATP-binding protein [Mesorhizobium sp. ISC25]|uniref:sugar ABC transporter ATP-binding protein n=1 Tax=Mesorhizobium sp. ISC25 TaxID=3077335 RepID=UPI0035D93C08